MWFNLLVLLVLTSDIVSMIFGLCVISWLLTEKPDMKKFGKWLGLKLDKR